MNQVEDVKQNGDTPSVERARMVINVSIGAQHRILNEAPFIGFIAILLSFLLLLSIENDTGCCLLMNSFLLLFFLLNYYIFCFREN